MKTNSCSIVIVGAIITTILMSFFFFPIQLSILPSVNTKMGLAALGLLWLIVNMARGNKAEFTNDIFVSSFLALLVSLVGQISIILNNTHDTAYSSYIVSMWVWLGAAYFCVSMIRLVHGKASIKLIINYLVAVCTFQCVSAIMIEHIPAVRAFAIRHIVAFSGIADMGEMLEKKRLFGFGACLDVAGSRFAAALIMIAYLLTNTKDESVVRFSPIYLLCFMVLSVIGNMMARTTIAGDIAALLIWTIQGIKLRLGNSGRYILKWFAFLLVVAIASATFFYNTNDIVREDIRFAFEGFFSLVETGHWQTNSNDMLMHHYIFPDNVKTWLIGDGFFGTPLKFDPYYVGTNYSGFYKGTDVGYCRFIFYFGLIGLLLFSSFIVTVGYYCSQKNREYSILFAFIVILNFVVWLKVSTDVFLVFALFLCLTKEEQKNESPSSALESDYLR